MKISIKGWQLLGLMTVSFAVGNTFAQINYFPDVYIYNAGSSAPSEGSSSVFRITRSSQPFDGGEDITFQITGTASYPSDFSAPTDNYHTAPITLTWNQQALSWEGVARFPPSIWEMLVTVNFIADGIVEADETLVVGIRQSSFYTVKNGPASITVKDIDSIISLNPASVTTIVEGDPQAATIVRFQRGQAWSSVQPVNFTFGGSATPETDLNISQNATKVSGSSWTVTIEKDALFADVTMSAKADRLLETDEVVTVSLASGLYKITTDTTKTTTSFTIKDNEPTISVAAINATASENGDQGLYTITRSKGDMTQDLRVNLGFSGSAIFGTDFTAPTFVVIPAGKPSADLIVQPIDDSAFEDTEQIIVQIVNTTPASYKIDPQKNTAVIQLLDNDPKISIVATDPSASRIGRNSGSFTLSRTGDPAKDLKVNLSVGGSALNGGDYAKIASTLTVPAGQAFATIAIAPLPNSTSSGDKTVILTLTPDLAYQIVLGAGSAQVMISDNSASQNLGAINRDSTSAMPGPTTKRLIRGTGSDPSYESFVIPLDFQKGIRLPEMGPIAGKENLWVFNLSAGQRSTGYHFDHNAGTWSIHFENPIAAFGSSAGGSHLYFNQPYAFGGYSGGTAAGRSASVRIRVYNRSDLQQVGSPTVISIPTETDPEWPAFVANDYTKTVIIPGATLTNIFSRRAAVRWGVAAFNYAWVLTHRAGEASKDYYFVVEAQGVGATPYDWLVRADPLNPATAGFCPLYSLEFERMPAWRPEFVEQPQFYSTNAAPVPYQAAGGALAGVTVPGNPSDYGSPELDNSPELRRHPILDTFVQSMGNDPLALANYVLNEIELTDAMDYTEPTYPYLQSINLRGVHRNALGTFLEGQGSPWDQCALLVYLLRAANVPAVYVMPSSRSGGFLRMSDLDVSKMLGLQVKSALNPNGNPAIPRSLGVNYPWVALWLNSEQRWVSIFPWLKDNDIEEGLDLYDYLPESYNTGLKWVSHYIYSDPEILSLSNESDQMIDLFPKFIQKTLNANFPGIAPEDLGVKIHTRRRYFSKWDDFPKPQFLTTSGCKVGKNISAFAPLTPGIPDLFDTIQIEVSSGQTKIDTGEMILADLHNRKLTLRFEGTPSAPTMTLALAPFRPSSPEPAPKQFPVTTPSLNGVAAYSSSIQLNTPPATSILYKVTHRRLRRLSNASLPGHDDALNPWQYAWPEVGEVSRGVLFQRTETFNLGDCVAFTWNPGRVTPKMLEVHAKELWQFERDKLNNPGATLTSADANIYQGTTLHLMGMSYWEGTSRFAALTEQLHKIRSLGGWGHGFAILRPQRDSSGNLASPITSVEPALHIPSQSRAYCFNGTLHPDSGRDFWSAGIDSFVLSSAASSALEHGTINRFFKQARAASTIHLCHLAGSSSVTLLTVVNYPDFASTVQGFDASFWSRISGYFNVPGYAGSYRQVFLTTRPIVSNPSYTGMGAFLLDDSGCQSLISGGYSGGNGEALPPSMLNQVAGAKPEARLEQDPSGYHVFNSQQPAASGLASSQFDPRTLTPLVTSLGTGNGPLDPFVLGTYLPQMSSVLGLPAGATPATILSDSIDALPTTGKELWHDQNNYLYDPVNALTGEFYIDTIDLTMPGPIVFELRRNYSSHNVANGLFGYGWNLNTVPQLTIGASGAVPDQYIYAAEMDGAVVVYTKSGAQWIPDPSKNRQMTTNPDRKIGAGNMYNSTITKATVGVQTVYTLKGPDGSYREFIERDFRIGTFTRRRPYLDKWHDNRGNSLSFSYGIDANELDFGEVKQIRSNNGNFVGFRYDVYGHIVEAFSRDTRRIYYRYDQYGDLTSVTLPDASEIQFEYQHKSTLLNGASQIYSTHLITREIKPEGRILENEYYDTGTRFARSVKIQRSTVGPDFRLVQNAFFDYHHTNLAGIDIPATTAIGSETEPWGCYTLITDVNNKQTEYVYANWLLIEIHDALNIEQGASRPIFQNQWYLSTVGDGFKNSLQQTIDRRGLITGYKYDVRGNAKEISMTGDLTGDDPASSQSTVMTRTFDVQAGGDRLRQVIAFDGIKAVYQYNDPVRPYLPTSLEKWVPDGVGGYVLDSTTQLDYERVPTDPNALEFSDGLLHRETRAIGSEDQSITEWEHTPSGFISRETKRSGTTDPDVVTGFEYNLRGELTRTTVGDTRVINTFYDARGNVASKEVLEDGRLLSKDATYYNGNGEPVWTDGPRTNPEDYIWRDYDGAGRKTQEIRWRSKAKSDGSRVLPETGDNLYSTTFYEYDAFGNLTRTIDPRGNYVRFYYDSVGQLTKKEFYDGLDGSIKGTEQYDYEAGGLVKQATNPLSGTTQKFYTFTGKLRRQVNPDGSVLQWRYYPDGRPKREYLRNGNYWETTFDYLNRRITRTLRTAADVALASEVTTFDRRGNSKTHTDLDGYVFTSTYDGLDRLKSTIGPPATASSAQQTTSYTYDALGKLVIFRNGLGDITATYRDLLGRPTRIEVFPAGAGSPLTVSTYSYGPENYYSTKTEGSGANAIQSSSLTDTFGNEVLVRTGSYIPPSDGPTPVLPNHQPPPPPYFEYSLKAYDMAGNLILSQNELGEQTTFSYDALNRLRTTTLPDGAATTLDYDPAGNLTDRHLPGGGTWHAVYDNANRLLSEELKSRVQTEPSTRSVGYSYYPSTHVWAGLLQSRTDARGTVETISYDDFLRTSQRAALWDTGDDGNISVYQYNNRGLLTSLSQTTVKVPTLGTWLDWVSTRVERDYDGYQQIAEERVYVDPSAVPGAPTEYLHSRLGQKWDAAGRRSALLAYEPGGAINISLGYHYQADGRLSIIDDVSWYRYTDAGLISIRHHNPYETTVDARDLRGRPTSITTSRPGTTLPVMVETLQWRKNSRLETYTASRDFVDSRSYQYNSRGQLTSETFKPTSSTDTTIGYGFDSDKLGIRTSVSLSGAGEGTFSWVGYPNNYSQVWQEELSWLPRVANGVADGASKVFAFLDSSYPVGTIFDTAGRWVAQIDVSAGSHLLTAGAVRFLNNQPIVAESQFQLSVDFAFPDLRDSFYDGNGNGGTRNWSGGDDLYSWDSDNRLVNIVTHSTHAQTTDLDTMKWDAVYDGLGRRLRTTYSIALAASAQGASPLPMTISSIYDPQVEFLEIGVGLHYGTPAWSPWSSPMTWKIYGPDSSGGFGGAQGVGGLEATYPDGGAYTFDSIVNDYFGNAVGFYVSNDPAQNGEHWKATRVSGYGPLPGHKAPIFSYGVSLGEATLWRGQRIDPTGLYYLGARYYEPASGRFLSPDPLGHGASPSLYDFCAGDPINSFDPDGRLGKQWTDHAMTYEGNVNNVGDFFSAVAYTVAGSALRAVGSIPSVFAQASEGMAEAHQEINTYTGRDAFLARTLSLPTDIAFSTTKLVLDPVDTVPQIPEALIELGHRTLTDPKQFVNNPSVNNGFNIVDDAVAWYMLGKTVQGISGNITTPGTSPGTITVSRWGRSGLRSGDWVMNGPASTWNYLRSFKWQPGAGNQYAPPSSGEQFSVPAGSVQWPSGWGIDGTWKGIFGQRRYIPETPTPPTPAASAH